MTTPAAPGAAMVGNPAGGGYMAGTTYEIRIVGPLPAELLPELGDVTVVDLEPRTVLTGHFVDQAALHGFLQRLRAFGLELVEVRSVATPESDEPPGGRKMS
jgi:hypothetical protein